MRWTTATGALGIILALALVGLPAARRLGPPETVVPGKPVAPFFLQDATGRSLDLSELAPQGSSALVLVYWSPRCPISRGYEARLGDLAMATAERGVRWYAVVADAEVPEAELSATTGPGDSRSRCSATVGLPRPAAWGSPPRHRRSLSMAKANWPTLAPSTRTCSATGRAARRISPPRSRRFWLATHPFRPSRGASEPRSRDPAPGWRDSDPACSSPATREERTP